LGKFGTPCARMHRAKARVKLPVPSLPWAPPVLPDEMFPELEVGLPVGLAEFAGVEFACGVVVAELQPAIKARAATAMATGKPRLRRPSRPIRAARVVERVFIFSPSLSASRQVIAKGWSHGGHRR
jgi:hypothetical protein